MIFIQLWLVWRLTGDLLITKDKWFKDNNLSDNQMYAEKILEKFKLYKYHFVYDAYRNLSLLIENNLKKYKININRKNT